jgi:hypothetical protein
MKKTALLPIFYAFLLLVLQACSSSADSPTPLSRLKGRWNETKTKTTITVTRGLPTLLAIALGGSTFSLDTIRPIKALNFISDKEVEVTLRQGTQEQITKANWKFIDNNQSIEFSGLSNTTPVAGTATIPSTFTAKILTPNYSTDLQLEASFTFNNFNFQAPTVGNLNLDATVKLTIDLKKQ